MRPVLRLFFSSVVTVFASNIAFAATQLPPLPAQKTPFAAAKQSQVKQMTERDGGAAGIQCEILYYF